MFSRALIKISAPSVLLRAGIQRRSLRPLSRAAGESSSCNDRKDESASSSALLKSVSGVIAGSGLGLWFWWASFPSTEPALAFADRAAVDAAASVRDGDPRGHSSGLPDPPQEKKTKYLFRGKR